MKVVTIDVPALGNRCHLVHDGRVGRGDRPAARHPRGRASGRAASRSRSSRSPTPTCTTTTSPEPSAWPAGTAPTTSSRPTRRSSSSGSACAHGDVLRYGALEVEVLATPGHTRHHQSFLAGMPSEPRRCSPAEACCTAPSAAPTWSTRGWPAGSPRPSGPAPASRPSSTPATVVHPTHGFGSFCAAGAADRHRRRRHPIGDQLATHPALTTDRETFVTDLVAGFGPVPAHYAHMAPLNRKGAGSAAARARPAPRPPSRSPTPCWPARG